MGMDYSGADKHKQYLFEYKQDKLIAGQNVTITPNADGKTATISASGGGGGSSAIADLTDVDLTNPTDGQVLAYDATNDEWVNVNQSGGVSELANLDDVSITSPTDGQTLRYDAANQEWINDNASGGNYAPVIYSLEEREIGVWTDGKPLYQKTITFQSSNSVYSMSVPHGISNLDRVTNYFGCIKEGNLSRFVPQHYTHANDSDYYIYDISVYNISQNDVRIVYDQWLKANPQTIDLTIQYTKTTDVPGSGTWGTDGVPMVHYDENEKVIGTYLGKPLYQKTLTNITFPSGQTSYAHNLNIDDYVSVEGWCKVNNGTDKMAFPFYQHRWNGYCEIISYSTNMITLDSTWNNNTAELTIKYTKTND